jgi:hypothetical protein
MQTDSSLIQILRILLSFVLTIIGIALIFLENNPVYGVSTILVAVLLLWDFKRKNISTGEIVKDAVKDED